MTKTVETNLDFWENFRRVLRQTRMAANMTQDVVAAALGITRSAYTYYESGKAVPDLAAVRKMAEIFKVPVEIFIYPERVPEAGAEKPQRAHPTPTPAPETMGQLSREEQELVAKFRAQAAEQPSSPQQDA